MQSSRGAQPRACPPVDTLAGCPFAVRLRAAARALHLKSPIVRRAVTIGGHSTTVGLEAPFWDGLDVIAKDLGVPIGQLITNVAKAAADSPTPGNLASALRVYVLGYYRQRRASLAAAAAAGSAAGLKPTDA